MRQGESGRKGGNTAHVSNLPGAVPFSLWKMLKTQPQVSWEMRLLI